MNTFDEQENTEKVMDYRQDLLSKFHRKQNKHLASFSEGKNRKKYDNIH